VANHHPGQLISTLQDVPPGWNDVLSFLDVAAPDAIALPEVIRLLEVVESEVSMAELPKTWYAPTAEVAVVFSARNLSGELARQEYDALKCRLLRLLAGDHAVTTDDPFDAQLVKDSDGYELVWTAQAKTRLVAVGFYPAARLRVAYDVVDQWDVSGLPGPLIAHSLAAMAGADLHELVRRGGVRVLLGTGAIVWQRLPP
jgi:hypothetical protein